MAVESASVGGGEPAAAAALCGSGEFEAARALLENAVRQAPGHVDAWLFLAKVELQLGRREQALQSASRAVELDARRAEAFYVLGRIHKTFDEDDAAESCFRRAVQLDPDNPDILTSLGSLFRLRGRVEDAIALYQQALLINPDHAEARRNLANARAVVQRATAPGKSVYYDLPAAARTAPRTPPASPTPPIPPTPEDHLRRTADELAKQGKLRESLTALEEAINIAPEASDLRLAAGKVALQLGLMTTSLRHCEETVCLDPSSFEAVDMARQISVGGGLYERAMHYSELAYRLAPSEDLRITRRFPLPAISASSEAIRAARQQYEAALDEALASRWQPANPYNALQLPYFFLAYHGENDRELQIKAARVCLQVAPSLAMTAPHCQAPARRPGKIRVGFISRYLASHSIGKTTRGLIEQLSRERFEVYALRITPSADDATTQLIRAAADHTVTLDKEIRRAREQIAALELDVLFYQDIGMEPTSWFLAFARLAPVQCVSFGHPNTTGIPNMDYFISNDLYETPESATHYSERLFLLHDLPTLAYYYKPAVPASPPDRSAFGLSDDSTVYLCPQTLFKLHPDFDHALRGILTRDPKGVVALIRGPFDEWTQLLKQRFQRTMPEVADRVVFLGHQPPGAFMELLAAGDVTLDPIHFNGMNSSLESLAVGTPIVTLPTRLQRGRHTQAMYQRMNILDCVAKDPDDYIRIAVRLGTDRTYAREIRQRILERNHVLFENREVVKEFERFFIEALREKWGTA
jgi:protein O-GlcNAc transferase